MENPIHLYTSDDGHVRLQVALEQETVWLSLDQMTLLFERDKSVISRHIRKIFEEGELERAAVVAKNATTAADGKTYQVDYYNLDVIISVGYRVKSRRGVQFRQWATQTLRQHLVQGYTLHEKRLQERGIEIGQALALLQQTLANQSLVNAEGAAVLAVVQDYAKSWSLLQGYDEQNLAAVTARSPSRTSSPPLPNSRPRSSPKARQRNCSASCAATGLPLPSPPSNRALATATSTRISPAARRTCSISSSRTTRSPTATSAAAPFFSSGTCA